MDFVNQFKKVTKVLEFELEMQISTRRNILYTLLGAEIVSVTISRLFVLIPTRVLSPETQKMVNEAITESFTLPSESWTTARKCFDGSKQFQLHIDSSSNINPPVHSLAAHQKT